MKKCCAEFIGTFALVFAGTGAIIINDVSGGAITHAGISLTFGLIVAQWIKHWIQSEQRRSERPATVAVATRTGKLLLRPKASYGIESSLVKVQMR